MSAKHAQRLQVASRRAKVAAMILRGTTNQYEIAAKLGMEPENGRRTISYDIAAIEAEWKDKAARVLGAAKGKELDRLDALEAEYWAAWERSKQPRESHKAARRSRPEKGAEEATELRKEQRDGNPRFLEGILACIKKRCEILGLNAPVKVAPTSPDGNEQYTAEVTDGERAAAYERLIARLGGRLGGPPRNTEAAPN
jgi:hypothetical protein